MIAMSLNSELTTSPILRRSIAIGAWLNENSQMKISIAHPGHRGAYNKGMQAKRDGLPRVSPYKGCYLSKAAMEQAWLRGYDAQDRPSSAAAASGVAHG